VDRVPTAANVIHYAEIVKQKHFARRTISTLTNIISEAYGDTLSQKELSDKADAAVFNLTERQGEKNFKPISEIIGQVYEDVFYKIEHKTRVVGVPMGFPELDELTEGLQTGMYVIGARPSVGKSAMAFNIAWTAASGRNELGLVYPIGIFSLEMTEKQISQRLLCSVAQVNMRNAKKNGLTQDSSKRLSRASNDIHETPIYLNDKAGINIFELRAQARRMKKLYDIKLLIVDYLQLVRPGIECGTREQEVAYVSSNLKALSSDMDIPILVLSQLSRPPKVSENRRPTLSDLRESGAIEQDADCVVFIHRENLSKDEAYPEFKYELILAKQRNGEANVNIPIRFNSWCTQFESIPEAQTIEQEKAINKKAWID
jgi:replicative DNA helicase